MAIEHQLVHVLVRLFWQTAVVSTTNPRQTIRHKAIIARFEEFLGGTPQQPLYLIDVLPRFIGAAGANHFEGRLRRAPWDGSDPFTLPYAECTSPNRGADAGRCPSQQTVTAKLRPTTVFCELGRFSVAYRETIWRDAVRPACDVQAR